LRLDGGHNGIWISLPRLTGTLWFCSIPIGPQTIFCERSAPSRDEFRRRIDIAMGQW